MKPKVFKMGGAWIWQCDHQGAVGDEFHESDWRNPWDACLSAAMKHVALFHNDREPVETLEGP